MAVQKGADGLENFTLPYRAVSDTKTSFTKDLLANMEGNVPQEMQETFHVAIAPQPACNMSFSSPLVVETLEPPKIWRSDTLMKCYKAHPNIKEYLENEDLLKGLLPKDGRETVWNYGSTFLTNALSM